MHTKLNRRKFIVNSTLFGAGMLFTPSLLANPSFFETKNKVNGTYMGGLTPIALIDHSCLLAFSSGSLSQASQNCITTDIHLRNTPGNKGRLAVMLPSENQKLIELINIVKNGENAKHINEKRAIAFGWIAVNALHKHVNRLLQDLPHNKQVLARMHQDAMLIRSMSATDTDAGIDDVETMLNSLLVRTITRAHTLKPDNDDGIGWVNRMSAWRMQNKEYMTEFAKAIVSPDPELAGKGFFNEKDRLLVISKQLQKGSYIKPEELVKAIEDGVNEGSFAISMAEAATNIIYADKYFEDKITLSELERKLNI